MSSLLNMLLGSMTSESSVNSMAKKTGLSSKAVTALIAAALPILLKSLTANASSQGGLSSLMGALTQHKNTKSIADQISEADADDGDKIVGHIFGDNTTNVISQLASSTGVAAHDVSSVLDNMAPALMSSLSAATTAGQQQAAGAASPLEGLGDLSGLVGGLFGDAGESSGGGSLLGSLLGGGASQSSGLGGLLGGLFGGGKEEVNSQDDGTDLLGSLLNFKF